LNTFDLEPQGCTALSGLLTEKKYICSTREPKKGHSGHSLYLVKIVLTWGQCCIESLGRRFPVMVLDGTWFGARNQPPRYVINLPFGALQFSLQKRIKVFSISCAEVT